MTQSNSITRNILIATNLASVVIIGILLSRSQVNPDNPDDNPGYNSCYNCSVDDLHGETDAEFSTVTARYKTTHQELFNNFAKGVLNNSLYPNTGTIVTDKAFKDARSCWFHADTLKKFMCLTERYSGQLGIPSSKLGVRFYYAVYPDHYYRDITLSNRHTLYLTATQDMDNDGIYNDFDPRISAALGVITPISTLIEDSIPQTIFSIGGRAQVSMNEGDICPPGKGCISTINAIDNKKSFIPLNSAQ
jgi:hypothetical protein